MTDWGWKYSWDQLRCHRQHMFTVDQIKGYQERRQGGLNYIFYRDDKYTRFFSKFLATYKPPLEPRKKYRSAIAAFWPKPKNWLKSNVTKWP